ncbi:MAG: phage terminase small subunit P27 family [Candidatus Nanopelagicaceae bacterium]
MPAGRPPKPIEQKRLLGNPGNGKLPDQSKVIALPRLNTPPEHLTESAKENWFEIINVAPWVANTDGKLLLELCEKMELKKDIQEKLKQSEYVLYTDKGYAYANPLFGMLSTTTSEIVKLLSLLGLTPTDRTKLGVAEVKARSKIEELLLMKNEK